MQHPSTPATPPELWIPPVVPLRLEDERDAPVELSVLPPTARKRRVSLTVQDDAQHAARATRPRSSSLIAHYDGKNTNNTAVGAQETLMYSRGLPQLDTEEQFFLREAKVTTDILEHLTEDDENGFDDTLFSSCQSFLKAHQVAVAARRDLRKKIQDRAERHADLKRVTTFWARTLRTLDDPKSSFKAFWVFVTVATLVVASCVTTIVSTLPAYNPVVKEEYLILWNLVDLALGLAFTAETGLRFLACVLDTTMPTSRLQNIYRFFTKPSNLVDLVSIAPSYVQLAVSPKSRVITGTLRTVRLLRLFKILRFYKPVRMLQKALRFAGKGLVAPILFLVTILVFISAGAYYAESGEYDPNVHQFLLDDDPVCVFEPSYFLSLRDRVPNYAPTNVNISSNVTPTPTTARPSLPPGVAWESSSGVSSSSSSSSQYRSQGDEKLPDASDLGPVIDHLNCPVSQSMFVTIIQSSWWAISTMSSAGFGDFVTVTGIGRVLAVFGILAGIILNAMPIAVIDASFVTTLQTEEDQELREEARRKRDDQNVKLSGGGGGEGDGTVVTTSPQLAPMATSTKMRLDDDKFSLSSNSMNLDTALLLADGGNSSIFARSAVAEQQVRDSRWLDALTPRTQAELLLLHLQLLSQSQVIDLANPSDNVLYIVDTLLEAAVTNTAAELAVWHNRKYQQRHMWGAGAAVVGTDIPSSTTTAPLDGASEEEHVTVVVGATGEVIGDPKHEPKSSKSKNSVVQLREHEDVIWCPRYMSALSLWTAKTQTNIAREAQVAGLLVQNPLGEQREVYAERYLLTQPLRLPVGLDPNGGPVWFTTNEDGDNCDSDGSVGAHVSGGATTTGSVNVLDRNLLMRLRRSRHDAIARSVLLPTRSAFTQQSSSSGNKSMTIGDAFGRPRIAGSGLAPSPGGSSNRFQPLDFSSIQHEHCWMVLHRAWGRSNHLLIPRRPPAMLFDGANSIEEDINTVQVLRYQHHTRTWVLVVPVVVENRTCTNDAPAGSLHKFRSRVAQPCNAIHSGAATVLCGGGEQMQLSRGTTLSTRSDCEVARQMLTQLRRRSHFDTLVALDKQLAASRMTYRAQRQAKEQEEAKKARSAKAKKDAETRELLDALSSEKKEAFALLQRLDLDTSTVASSADRLSLLALASTAADKLERERAVERSIARKRFAVMTRVCSEEQSPRYLLLAGDMVLMSGGASLESRPATATTPQGGMSFAAECSLAATALRVAQLLPSFDDVMKFADTRRGEQLHAQRGLALVATAHSNAAATTSTSGAISRHASRAHGHADGSTRARQGNAAPGAGSRARPPSESAPVPAVTPWPVLDALSPILGNTLLYVYS